MAKQSAALTRLLVGLDHPDSQDPAGFGREDVSEQLRIGRSLKYKDFLELHSLPAQPGLQPGRTGEAPTCAERMSMRLLKRIVRHTCVGMRPHRLFVRAMVCVPTSARACSFKAAIIGAVLLALLIPAGASAQTPDPTPVEGKHGAAYVSYGYTSGSSASLDNLQFDVDLQVPGTVVSVYRPLHRPDRRARRTDRRVSGRPHYRVR